MKVYRDGIEIFELKDYKQTGRFMEVASIDCTVKSSVPVDFSIGDYVIFDYNGLTYSLYDTPTLKKQARSGSYGEAFIYELKFKADTEELSICPFLDLVANDNSIHYTSLPSFSTFEDVYGIVARLQANMDYLYPNRWVFRVHNSDDAELMEALYEAKEFAISGESCLEGLKKIYDTWGVSFIHTYEDGKNVITLGKSAGTTSLFRYGKGQGLRTIKKNIQNADQLCTRAYVYGSTRNIPARWYNDKGYIGESQFAPNLMIPPSKWVDGVPQGAYIDAIFGDDNRIEKYGLKIKTFSYDGSDSNKDEIYPSVEKVTMADVRNAKVEIGDYSHMPSSRYTDSERVDLVLEGSSVIDDGIGTESGYVLYSDKISAEIKEESDTIATAEMRGESKYDLIPISRTFNLCSFEVAQPATYRIEDADSLFTFEKNDLQSTVSVEFYVKIPTGDFIKVGSPFSFTSALNQDISLTDLTFNATTAGKYSLIAKLSVVWSENYVVPEIGEDVYLKYSIEATTIDFARGERELDDFFTIKLKQIGFNIDNYTAASGSNKAIHIKNGMCGGRTFNIVSSKYNSSDDSWELQCRRNEDSSVSQRFPNSIFPISTGDQFVLLNINMPDLYVYTAMQRLYSTALADLKYLSLPQYVIEPEIDNLQMARSPQILKEGMYMSIDDADIAFSEDVLIDSVTINNKGTELRTFEVALRNDKIYNKLTKIASRIADLESLAAQTAKDAASTPASSSTQTEVLSTSSAGDSLLEKVNIGTEEEPIWAVKPKNIGDAVVGIISDTFITAGGVNDGDDEDEGDGKYLPITGGTLKGDLRLKGDLDWGTRLYFGDGDYAFIGEDEDDAITINGATIKLNGVVVINGEEYTGSGNINSEALESYLKPYLTKTDASALYVTQSKFNSLNTQFNDFLAGSDTDTIINKWKELENFLSGQTETSTLAELLAVKADKTTLDAHISTYNTFVNTTYAAHITAYNNHISAYNTHITEYNTFKTDTQKRLDALEALWAIDEENNGLYPKSGRGIWSESYITAGGIGETGSGSGGLIQNVYGYGDLGGTFSNTNLTDTFNAYTINQLYTSGESIKSRIEVLESNMGVINPDTLLSLNNSIASNFNRITSIEDWINNPTAEVAYFNELGVRDKLNVSGPATFDERITGVITEAVNLTGTPEVKISENTIAILIGEKVSAYITVPYAVKALNDSNGSSIVDTYASKADVNSLTSTLADHLVRIIGIEDALLYPSFDTLYTNELGIRDKLNVAGPTTFDSSVTADVFTGLATKAIADKNNNDITTTYALKLEIGAAIEQIAKLNDNITSIEDWMVNASAETLLVRELGVLDKINVSGPATFDDTTAFTGKTTHNGGIGATTGTFSSSLSAGATTLSSLNVTGASSLTTITATKITVTNSSSDAITVNGNVNISGTAWMGSLGSSNSKVNNAYITTANISTLYANSGQIYGNLRLKGDSSNYGNYLYFGDGSYCYIAELDDDKMTIYASSGLQITANTNVTGNIYATGAITAGSDARYKSKLQDVAVDVEVIANAPLFDYKWKDREDNRTYLGTTAQYWNNTAFKNAVIPTTDEKLWTMSYSQIAMGNTIILARELLPIKRKVSEIDSLKDRLHKAERRIEVLEQELNQYRRA